MIVLPPVTVVRHEFDDTSEAETLGSDPTSRGSGWSVDRRRPERTVYAMTTSDASTSANDDLIDSTATALITTPEATTPDATTHESTTQESGDTDTQIKNKGLLALLPEDLRVDLDQLARDRYDEAVSEEEWLARGNALSQRASTLPSAVRVAFHAAIASYAKAERKANKRAEREAARSRQRQRRGRSGNPAARHTN